MVKSPTIFSTAEYLVCGKSLNLKNPKTVTSKLAVHCEMIYYIRLMRRNIDRQTATRQHEKLTTTKQKQCTQEKLR